MSNLKERQMLNQKLTEAILNLATLKVTANFLELNCMSFFPGGSDGKETACNAETQVQSLGQEDPLEKEMATHSSTVGWKILWMEEGGRLQSMGSQRVRHN